MDDQNRGTSISKNPMWQRDVFGVWTGLGDFFGYVWDCGDDFGSNLEIEACEFQAPWWPEKF